MSDLICQHDECCPWRRCAHPKCCGYLVASETDDVEQGRACPYCCALLTEHNKAVWEAGYAAGARHQANAVKVHMKHEWRVETDETTDDFESDQQAALAWMSRIADQPGWLPGTLLRRTVVTTVSNWEEAR